MANEVEKLNSIAILSIEKVNTLTDDNIEKINTLNFLGVPPYMTATGGTITTDGDYKVHTFTSGGTWTVTTIGQAGAGNQVQYLVIGSGGGGGNNTAGGGGAGAYRTATGFTVTETGYTITVGSGGAGATTSQYRGSVGNNSIFSSITSNG